MVDGRGTKSERPGGSASCGVIGTWGACAAKATISASRVACESRVVLSLHRPGSWYGRAPELPRACCFAPLVRER